MAQKITLDTNNKLVIFTDNGRIDGDNNQTTEIKGTFEIEAKDVAILGALINDMTLTYTYHIFTPVFHIVSKDNVLHNLEDFYHQCLTAYNNLKAKVEEHNKRPFSRKIKLD